MSMADVSCFSSVPKESLPMGDNNSVDKSSGDLLCAASATFLPTPPSVMSTVPGDVECSADCMALDVMSIADAPMTTSLGEGREERGREGGCVLGVVAVGAGNDAERYIAGRSSCS